jgi:Holliday junction resolvase-like predicted endonuclease
MRTEQQRAGDAAEELVAARLAAQGWLILGRNVRVGRLELDLVAVDPTPVPALVVVEVRWRRRRDYGLGEETVDFRKRARLRRGAYGLLESGRLPDGRLVPVLPIRLDLVVVEPGEGDGDVRVRHHRSLA